mmetsp:Transcript_1617/g.2422  ORF Transcript_1617/g.2422 Transcript_1617/m.2422 type:complete len:250 (-) Transcript_1617:17-766(-)|eukprot:CAMPEP_0171461770 /NCGR_PEP_ID=MMETSP0945-20130129/6082_1 /TAXON_ID=109269 /ORGANISM="Vaucheria litorea, Strain CCMP2940" /LENGTH=249 /DNA_ID=CAMNT_0011988177 /DNA_START=58 /DNA_END=807 /DNA_ORIENTATION=+
MDYKEEQCMEVEALEAIYPDEFNKTSSDPLQWKIKIVPFANGKDENHVEVTLQCSICENYPDESPSFQIEQVKGLSKDEIEELENLVTNVVEENVGIVVGYTLTEAIREWLVEHNQSASDNSMHASMLRRMDAKTKEDNLAREKDGITQDERDAEELLRIKRLEGTPVTPSTFAEWIDRFIQEQINQNSSAKNMNGKLTGKEMFLQHLVKEEDFDEDEMSDLLQGQDESLFLEGDYDEKSLEFTDSDEN